MINIKSEIKPLKKVLLHRPGEELLNLTPDTFATLLFDDIPYLKIARQEHDEFAKILRDNGVEVVYLEDLVTEALDSSPEIKDRFIKQFVKEAGIKSKKYREAVIDYLKGFGDTKELVLKTMSGININDVTSLEKDSNHSLVDQVMEDSKFLADPMPNLVFTRDPFASIGNGISLNKMYSVTRNRETIYAEYILNIIKIIRVLRNIMIDIMIIILKVEIFLY